MTRRRRSRRWSSSWRRSRRRRRTCRGCPTDQEGRPDAKGSSASPCWARTAPGQRVVDEFPEGSLGEREALPWTAANARFDFKWAPPLDRETSPSPSPRRTCSRGAGERPHHRDRPAAMGVAQMGGAGHPGQAAHQPAAMAHQPLLHHQQQTQQQPQQPHLAREQPPAQPAQAKPPQPPPVRQARPRGSRCFRPGRRCSSW